MRRYKSPESLKKWRIEHEARQFVLEEQRKEHEEKMMQWAIEHATTGPCVICPDGKVRTVPAHLFRFRRNVSIF